MALFWYTSYVMTRVIFFLLRVSVNGADIKTLKSKTPCIFVANHTSMIDSYFMGSRLPSSCLLIGKYGAKKYPLYGKFFSWSKVTYFVKRNDKKQSRSVVKTIIKEIKENNFSLFLFPEGKIIEENKIGPFKKGAFDIAIRSELPIVPIFIENYPSIQDPKSFFIKSGVVKMHVLENIETDNLNNSDILELSNKVREKFVMIKDKKLTS